MASEFNLHHMSEYDIIYIIHHYGIHIQRVQHKKCLVPLQF